MCRKEGPARARSETARGARPRILSLIGLRSQDRRFSRVYACEGRDVVEGVRLHFVE